MGSKATQAYAGTQQTPTLPPALCGWGLFSADEPSLFSVRDKHLQLGWRVVRHSMQILLSCSTSCISYIVGLVLLLAQVTIYDLCYAVNQLTRAHSKPAMVHITAAKHLLRYLEGSPDLAIIYKKGQFAMHGYTDAPFAVNPENVRPTTGYLFLLDGAPISFWLPCFQVVNLPVSNPIHSGTTS